MDKQSLNELSILQVLNKIYQKLEVISENMGIQDIPVKQNVEPILHSKEEFDKLVNEVKQSGKSLSDAQQQFLDSIINFCKEKKYVTAKQFSAIEKMK